ncbi:MAG: hypothetical protein ACYTKD_17225 [Planctomycetota bacterium]
MSEDTADTPPGAPDGPETPDGSGAPPDETETTGRPGADGDAADPSPPPADGPAPETTEPGEEPMGPDVGEGGPVAASDGEDAGDGGDADDAGDASKTSDASDAGDDDKPVWGPPAAVRRDAEMVFGDAEALFTTDFTTDDATDSATEAATEAVTDDAADEAEDDDDEDPPPPPRGTPLRIPVARARRPGVFAAVLRACWEELNYPRARVRARLRRAANRMKERRLVASLLWGTLAGATFILYASGVGVTRGVAAWTVFVGVALGLAAGGPAMLVHAWPAAVAAPLVACAWAGWAFGPGALWLGLATCSGLLALYFAAAEAAPVIAAAAVSWLALHLTGSAEGGTRLAVAGAVFAASAAVFIALRKHVTAPIVAACWVVLSGVTAARVAWWTLGQAVPTTWAVQALPGPRGLAACVAGAAFGAALFSWPRRRETVTQAILAVWRPKVHDR